MALREDLEKQGRWLFKRRSYLPLLGIPIVLIALRNSEYLERVFGDTIENFWDFFLFSYLFWGWVCVVSRLAMFPEGHREEAHDG